MEGGDGRNEAGKRTGVGVEEGLGGGGAGGGVTRRTAGVRQSGEGSRRGYSTSGTQPRSSASFSSLSTVAAAQQ